MENAHGAQHLGESTIPSIGNKRGKVGRYTAMNQQPEAAVGGEEPLLGESIISTEV